MLSFHGSTKFFILVLMFLKYVIFCVYPWCDLLWYNFFLIFQDSVWLVKKSWCVHCFSIHLFYYWISDRRRIRYALWWVFVRKSCRHKLVVSTSFWYWLLNVSSVQTSLKYTATIFWVANEMWVCYWLMVVLSFSFWSLCFWNMSLFVFILDAIFCGTIFFSFFRQCVTS